MSDLSAYLAAVVLLGFAGYRLATDHDAPSYATRRHGYGLLICLALAMVLLAPATPRLLTGLGANGVTVIALGEAVRTAAVSLLMFMACSLRRRPIRGVPLGAAVLTQVVMITLFLSARPSLAADGSVLVPGAGRWPVAVHDLVFAAYSEWTVITAAFVLRDEARRVGAGQLRLGIRLVLAACGVAVIWAAWTGDDIVNVLRTGIQDGSEDLVSNVLGALCAILIVAGTLVVKWHGLFTAVLAHCRSYVAYRRLGPLWEALRAELPELALEEERRGPLRTRVPLRDLDFALYRRVIEIHDGRLSLRPYAPGRGLIADGLERTHPEAMRGAEREALIEAASIAVALDQHRAGRGFADRTAEDPPEPPMAASGTMDAEAAWLTRVSAAFSRLRTPQLLADMYPDPEHIHLRS